MNILGCEIFIENGILKNFCEKINFKPKTFAIITDKNVSALYEKTVTETLRNAGFNVISFAVPPGEKSKSAKVFFALQNFLAQKQITRTDAIIALGGGVVGDLAGFVAATYLRGVPFFQVPTTLLAMVDSSVGGKTGIDIPAGKNLVGAFHRPRAVFCDPEVLFTLKKQVFRDGCAEIIKHGMIRSEFILHESKNIKKNIIRIVEENIKIKGEIVTRDELDTGERQLLNFGHTIGHAIETLSNFKLSHGKAVAIGMAIITRAAAKKNFCPPECSEILHALLKKNSLPSETKFSAREIFSAALADKKRDADTITEVLPKKIGECVLRKMPVHELLDWIETGMEK
ncbi:MAG: 3-dehydroquinate synthase [Defluviitaleaceae bacterium]|nr:3-dehydroquinate synthase [Defluviitaleaceae bacterium]